MKYVYVVLLSCTLFTAAFAQEELLGKTKTDALTLIPAKSTSALEGKNYPLIKETIKLEGLTDWNNVSTVYLFIDSTDKVARLHLVYNNISPDEKQKLTTQLTGQLKKKNDLSDKKLATYTWNTNTADYLFTWSKDKDRRTAYLIITTIDYKQRMLNYLINGGGMLPDDGIFTPAPSK